MPTTIIPKEKAKGKAKAKSKAKAKPLASPLQASAQVDSPMPEINTGAAPHPPIPEEDRSKVRFYFRTSKFKHINKTFDSNHFFNPSWPSLNFPINLFARIGN